METVELVKLRANGVVTIPSSILKRMGLKAGADLVITEEEKTIILRQKDETWREEISLLLDRIRSRNTQYTDEEIQRIVDDAVFAVRSQARG